MTEHKFTPGTLAAADLLFGGKNLRSVCMKVEQAAEIIDRKTHAGEMYGLLKKVKRMDEDSEGLYAKHNHQFGEIVREARRIKAAIDGEG